MQIEDDEFFPAPPPNPPALPVIDHLPTYSEACRDPPPSYWSVTRSDSSRPRSQSLRRPLGSNRDSPLQIRYNNFERQWQARQRTLEQRLLALPSGPSRLRLGTSPPASPPSRSRSPSLGELEEQLLGFRLRTPAQNTTMSEVTVPATQTSDATSTNGTADHAEDLLTRTEDPVPPPQAIHRPTRGARGTARGRGRGRGATARKPASRRRSKSTVLNEEQGTGEAGAPIPSGDADVGTVGTPARATNLIVDLESEDEDMLQDGDIPAVDSELPTTCVEQPPPTISLLISIAIPPKVPTARRDRKGKPVKQAPLQLGPAMLSLSTTTWAALLETIADVSQTTVRCLNLPSMAWRPNKPANATPLPLRDEMGFQLLQSQVQSRRYDIIVVSMSPPLSSPTVLLPWAQHSGGPMGTGSLGPGAVADTSPTKEDGSSDEEESRTSKRARFDHELEDLAMELMEKYKGACSDHAAEACYYHEATGSHYFLNRGRALVWAHAIRTKKADMLKAPLATNMFKKADCTTTSRAKGKGKEKEAPESTETKAPGAHQSVHPNPYPPPVQVPHMPSAMPLQHPFAHAGMLANPVPFFPHSQAYPGSMFHNNQFLPFGGPLTSSPLASSPFSSYYGAISMPPSPYGSGPVPLAHATRQLQSSHEPYYHLPHTGTRRSSSPIPIPCLITVEEFCNQYGLDDRILAALHRMHFSIGDNIDRIRPSTYENAGFTELSWERVLRAYYRYKEDVGAM
ncbi:hypothetical protein BXZ70DRAFT_1052116 [Cristinia sonorae]|uniref:Uncharacterized protein n=1 Tax=Cristinia sonorae TaxID=1940300 RepID=A0A8K0UUQ5_9AGAR|nr:hypothetical protein BXZ70DRAFT_1052116 [Cristinia sonorae]